MKNIYEFEIKALKARRNATRDDIEHIESLIKFIQQDGISNEQRGSIVDELKERRALKTETLFLLEERADLAKAILQKEHLLRRDIANYAHALADHIEKTKGTETPQDEEAYRGFEDQIVSIYPDIPSEARKAIFSLGVFYGRYIGMSEQGTKRKEFSDKGGQALHTVNRFRGGIRQAAKALGKSLWDNNPNIMINQTDTCKQIFPLLNAACMDLLRQRPNPLSEDELSMFASVIPAAHDSLKPAIRDLVDEMGRDDLKKKGRKKQLRKNARIVKAHDISIIDYI